MMMMMPGSAVVMVVIFKTGAGRIVISYRLALAAQNSMNTMMMSIQVLMIMMLKMMIMRKCTEVR